MSLPLPPASRTPSSIFESWRESLRLRPLLWLAPCVVVGGALGFQLTALGIAAANAILFRALLLFVALCCFCLAILWRGRKPIASRVAFGACCIVAMSAHAALRVLPAANDISHLAAENFSRAAPLRAQVLTVRGFVADHPRRGEFSTQFPLQCVERGEANARKETKGRIWVWAPPDVAVEVGDAIQVQGELRPLPRATNPGQREEAWRYVLENCWSGLEAQSIRPLRAAPKFALSEFAFKRKIAKWREAVLSHFEKSFLARSTPYPRANAQLLTAMTFGEGGLIAPLPRRVRDDFRAAGLSHVLVASGTQIAFFGALLLGLGKLLGLRGGWLLALVVPTLLLYAAIAGGAPSILRAAIAGVLVSLAVLAGRDVDTLSLWSLALIVLALLDPAQLMSLSLQLSFAAAWGMIVLAPLLQRRFHAAFGKNFFTELMAFSLGAQFGVLPILLFHFGRVSLTGIGANLLGVPLAGVLVATGIAGLFLPLAWLNELLVQNIAGIAGFFAALPGATIETPPVRLIPIVAGYALLLLALFSVDRGASSEFWSALKIEAQRGWRFQRARLPRPQSVFVIAIFLATCFAAFRFYSAQPQPLRMAMLDVGQGESVVIISPENRVVLIDGGGDNQGLRSDVGQSVIVPYLQARGVRKIDALVLTHADADHCNGLRSVLREVPVGMVLDGAQSNDATASEYLDLKREIQRRDIPLVKARAGQKLQLGSAALKVLAPLPPALQGDNNNSAVLRLEHEHTSVLLTGDIESEGEERLVRRGANLQCTVLKAAHHGSQSSTIPLFLKAAQPQIALLSCGRYNRFGHPSGTVLERLSKSGIAFFRTDLDGAIEVLSDGRKCWIQTTR